jgi:preprotein translocase subunit SecE
VVVGSSPAWPANTPDNAVSIGGVLSVVIFQEVCMPKVEKSIVRKQPNRIQRFFRESIGELRKVNWPTWQEAKNLTIIVLIVTLGMSSFLGLLDFIFTKLFALIFT